VQRGLNEIAPPGQLNRWPAYLFNRGKREVMKSNASQIFTHARILATLHLLYGVSAAFVLTIWIAMFLLFILFPTTNHAEDSANKELLIIALVLVPFLVVAPLGAGYGLLRNRKWMSIAIGISATSSLPVIFGVGFVFLWQLGDYSKLVYIIPCLIMFLYSVWFLWARPQANKSLQVSAG
jgi:hypothetical protein